MSARFQISAAIADDLRAVLDIHLIGDAAARFPRPAWIRTLCPVRVSSSTPTGNHGDAVFIRFNFRWDADYHRHTSYRQEQGTLPAQSFSAL